MANYHLPTDIVKNLSFGKEGREKIMSGIRQLSDAVESTLGASGRCVVYEDAQGGVVVTKDGVTVAQSIILKDPIENMGATLVKEAAQNTVQAAGDGTSSSTLIARYLTEYLFEEIENGASPRDVTETLNSGLEKIYKALEDSAVEVDDEKLESVATISCNNDKELGKIIGEAFAKVGKDGVVLIEDSETEQTYSDLVDGVQFDSGLRSRFLVTDKDRGVCELENPYVLIYSSPISNTNRLLGVIEHAMKNNRPLLIIGHVEENSQAYKSFIANKVKGTIKVNFVDPAGFGKYKHDTAEDLAILTGAKVINEELGDAATIATPDMLGEAIKAVTDDFKTVLTVDKEDNLDVEERIEKVRKLVSEEQNGFLKTKLEERLSMLSAKVGVIYVGANSEVELKEKRDRVDDAVHATKASLSGGIVSGGGVALRDASKLLDTSKCGERALHKAINKPLEIILKNAHLQNLEVEAKEGYGIDAVSGDVVNMIDANIVDPQLVTYTALKNAASVAKTIISADCIVSNVRVED